jgi:hypothetical protein
MSRKQNPVKNYLDAIRRWPWARRLFSRISGLAAPGQTRRLPHTAGGLTTTLLFTWLVGMGLGVLSIQHLADSAYRHFV